MAKRVITFGEIMMRLNPIGYLRLVQSDRFEATYAGGEANVAVSLANYGLDAAYVTKVPAHEVGQCAVNELRRYGVDTQYMIRGGDRLGIYFCEKGASQRASKVIYDRASSAIALAKRTDFDWDTIFDGADWFHWTGITPALGGELPEICLDACKAAKARGLTISCDLNFRKKLWTSQRAGEVMSQLLPYVDVCIANEEDAKDVFGIEAEGTDINSGKLNRDGYISVARQLSSRFGCKYVAITLRSSISANDNDWAGMLYEAAADKAYFSTTYHVHIVDRVGGGDSFGGVLPQTLHRARLQPCFRGRGRSTGRRQCLRPCAALSASLLRSLLSLNLSYGKGPDQLLLAGLFLFFGRRTVHSRKYGSRRARFAAWTLCSFKLCPFARAAGARVWRFPQCRRAHHRRHTALPGRARACQTVRAACRGRLSGLASPSHIRWYSPHLQNKKRQSARCILRRLPTALSAERSRSA